MFLWRLSLTGGIPRVVRSLLERLDRDRFDFHVCTARPLFEEDRLDELGEGIHFTTLGLAGKVSPIRKLDATRRLASVIREVKPDVVHVHSGVAWYLAPWLVANRHRVPTVLEVHDSPQSGRVSRANNAVEAIMMRRLGAIPLVHSSSVKSDLAAASRVGTDRIQTIPIGIDLEQFDRRLEARDWRRSVGIQDEETVISYVARLVASKNPRLFVEVAAAVAPQRPNCRFVLVGDGPAASVIGQQVSRAGLGEQFILLRNVEDVATVLAGSDIFLSTSDYEGFGIAVLEAMASRLPVVTTAAGGIDDLVVPGQTGLVAPVEGRQELVDSVLRLIDDAPARTAMGSRGWERATLEFGLPGMVTSYETLYRSMASPGHGRHSR